MACQAAPPSLVQVGGELMDRLDLNNLLPCGMWVILFKVVRAVSLALCCGARLSCACAVMCLLPSLVAPPLMSTRSEIEAAFVNCVSTCIYDL